WSLLSLHLFSSLLPPASRSTLFPYTTLFRSRLREQMWRAQNTRATEGEHDNRPIISKILELRKEKAQLLGFRDFADFQLDDRMADRKSTRLNSSHRTISYAVFCLNKKKPTV